jgi:hypothetical protein
MASWQGSKYRAAAERWHLGREVNIVQAPNDEHLGREVNIVQPPNDGVSAWK